MESAVDDIAAITNKQDAEIAGLRAELAKSQELQQTVRGMLGAEIDCIRLQRERLRAKLDRLEDAADEDAATIFSLRSELAATDQKWRDAVAELERALAWRSQGEVINVEVVHWCRDNIWRSGSLAEYMDDVEKNGQPTVHPYVAFRPQGERSET